MRSARHTEVLGYVAGNVRSLRSERGLTQEQLAELANQDLTYLQRVERGATNLSVGVLVALADALGVPPDRLLQRAEKPPTRRGRPKKSDPRG